MAILIELYKSPSLLILQNKDRFLQFFCFFFSEQREANDAHEKFQNSHFGAKLGIWEIICGPPPPPPQFRLGICQKSLGKRIARNGNI